ncbi:MAG TPA: MBL fold metallo-hydrolase [Actinomycetota bacterium]|nr:MBL fold metallo-hydrolase [Actinomycetota bacterium]
MQVTVCGVRGSTPAPGPEYVRYGGNTSCIALAQKDKPPKLVLDGGTGLRNLTTVLDGRPFRGTILLGHLHWDHTHGLPFFSAGDRPDSRVRVLLPAQGVRPEELMARFMSPPHFPVQVNELRGDWRVGELEEGDHTIEEFQVTALEIPHKGGRTFGFRVSDGVSTLAYLSDHHPIQLGPGPNGHGEYHEAAYALCEEVDLMVHDAQYTVAEFPARADFGHSTIDYAVGLAEACSAKRLLLFHHDPGRTDDELSRIVEGLAPGAAVDVEAATEGRVLDLGD